MRNKIFELQPKKEAASYTPEGVFEWGGAVDTTYWADPKEKLIGIIYRQLWGMTQCDIPNKYKVLVYQALND